MERSDSSMILKLKRRMEDLGINPNRRLSQNFLYDTGVAIEICKDIPSDGVKKYIEIGAGLGILTEIISRRGISIVVYEKDPKLCEYLREVIDSNVEIIHADVLDHMKEIIYHPGSYIFSNLPYGITSRFFGGLVDEIGYSLDKGGDWDDLFMGGTVMVQKEFAERIVSGTDKKTYGNISVKFQNLLDSRIHMNVGRNRFYPQPSVDSSVIHFEPKGEKGIEPRDYHLYKKTVDSCFGKRRKMLKNILSPDIYKGSIEEKDIKDILDAKNWSRLRPENLSPQEFVKLSNMIAELRDERS